MAARRRRDRGAVQLVRTDGTVAAAPAPEPEGPRAITAGPGPDDGTVDAELVEDSPTEATAEGDGEDAGRVYVLAPGQPPLRDSVPWPEETREWWAIWGQEDRSKLFSATDWQMLMDIALLHAAVWGSFDLAMIPRLNAAIAKFGGTPLDRAALAVRFAETAAAAAGVLEPDGVPAELAPPSSREEMRQRMGLVQGGRTA